VPDLKAQNCKWTDIASRDDWTGIFKAGRDGEGRDGGHGDQNVFIPSDE